MYDIISFMIEMSDAAQMFRALGEPTRLQLIWCLSCCPESVNNPSAGELCCQTTGASKITSTVSHHLKELREASLIQTDKQGKRVCCSLNRDTISELIVFLQAIQKGEGDECK